MVEFQISTNRLKNLITIILRLFIKISKNSIYFIPHPNCSIDAYDIVNYRSDNALSLLHYLLTNRNGKYEYFVDSYDPDKNKLYEEYVHNLNPEAQVIFVKNRTLFEKFRRKIYLLRSKYIFSSFYLFDLSFKSKRNISICLSYFTPFKYDYSKSLDVSLLNKSFDHFITTSLVSSFINSAVTRIELYKFHELGFPRNDNFKVVDKELLKIIEKQVGYSPKYIFLYTPTYRDYEQDVSKNILGYSCPLKELNEYFIKEKVALLYKLHPLSKIVYDLDSCQSFFNISKTRGLHGLYDYIPLVNTLITDYTSTYFDFLLLNRPVIFNFYDLPKYKKFRGLSYDPIESICSGDIVTSYTELVNSIKNLVSRSESVNLINYEQKRVNSFFNKYIDFDSSKRICSYFNI